MHLEVLSPLSPHQFLNLAAQESYAERRHQLHRDGREDEGENGEIQDGGDNQVFIENSTYVEAN